MYILSYIFPQPLNLTTLTAKDVTLNVLRIQFLDSTSPGAVLMVATTGDSAMILTAFVLTQVEERSLKLASIAVTECQNAQRMVRDVWYTISVYSKPTYTSLTRQLTLVWV